MAYEALYTRGRPKTLSQLVGQEHISNALARAISSNRLSHAYLLVGTRGTGKTSTARLLSKAMNCERVHDAQTSGRALDRKEIPCNKCDSCQNFDSSPDNVEFDAASNRSVEDVTRLLSTAYLAPLRARVKTFIIDEVHMLSFEAVNSILKLIEEPPPNVAFFLATTELNKVPMTIRSRCQVLNFRLIPQTTIAPYLLTLARRLKVTLHEDAAKKIARLAEGSMRDALTYLDQCYAMSDKEITLDNVNETLGLISDENLDDIISAVKAKDRAAVGKAITRAFRSGLAANVIAESLITRLRDIEFDMLDRNEKNFAELDKIIDALRTATGEMYGSGIPDIILEMALMKLVAPVQNFVATPLPVVQTSAPSKNLDEGRKIFYDVVNFLSAEDRTVTATTDAAAVTNFADDTLTLVFRSDALANVFKKNQRQFEQAAAQVAGRAIKFSVVVDVNLPPPVLNKMSEPYRSNLVGAMKIFNATDATKVSD
ncbi:MAG: DNA polymerase III subunit gamma/tau [Selenomonadaceae bacterium]|nr:DNA polymerase III subunit gamma/tau [Selenomonadaceae bacterium]